MTTGQQVLAHIDSTARSVEQAMPYVDYLGLEPPRDGEDAYGFRHRIAGALRERGMVIEAHEVQANARWDAEGQGGQQVVTGLTGHLAIAMQRGEPYSRDGVSQVGDELAAGAIVQAPPDPLRQAMDMLGPDAFLGLFGGGR